MKIPGNQEILISEFRAFWCSKFCSRPSAPFEVIEASHDYVVKEERQRQTFYLKLETIINIFDQCRCQNRIKGYCKKVRNDSISANIQSNQNSFIEGGSTVGGVQTIEEILEFAIYAKASGVLLAIDFEETFDSLSHSYLLKTLKKFNFGTQFVQLIKTFYTNISSCVLNNDLTTFLFNTQCGVRQGDSLSPLLFILVTEVLLAEFEKMKVLMWFLKKVYYRDYLGKIWRY